MTLNKFEKEIREKLQRREIKPSPEAWDKVSARLDAAAKPNGFPYFRYGIAAAFIGLLFLSVLYFRGRDIPEGEIEMVGNPVETTPAIREKADQKQLPETKQDAAITDTRDLPLPAGPKPEPPSKQPGQPDKVLAVRVLDSSRAAANTEKVFERLIEAKLEEVVADVHKMEQGGQALTDLEVDSLLRQAQEELFAGQSGRDTSVNATALLMEVEDELDESFREKLFNKLQEGFQKVRTAVADRNN